jgi:hypothetical protein
LPQVIGGEQASLQLESAQSCNEAAKVKAGYLGSLPLKRLNINDGSLVSSAVSISNRQLPLALPGSKQSSPAVPQ